MQPTYFAHANVFYHQGKPVPIELSIATIPNNGSDPQVMGITVNRAGLISTPHELRSNSHEHERLRLVHAPLPKSVPVEYLSFCVRGKLSQMGRGGLMVVKATEQQKIFIELGVFAMSLETLPEFNDIYDGTFPNSLHEEVHEDVSYSTMGRVVVYPASTPQVLGSINGPGNVNSAIHPCSIGSINEYQTCLGSKTPKVSLQTDYQIGTSVHALQRPMVTYIGMGIVVPGPHGLLCL
ncbi:hypothetical protein TNCV_4894571 [Trichonephila clavipes]|nr:hypothetical protein TNCV_4894571 [Trichonephila clavipes]